MAEVEGRLGWSASRGKEGQREYSITWLVRTGKGEGPQTASFATGLPSVGDFWNYGGDSDAWAFCTPQLAISTHSEQPKNEPGYFWQIKNTFSTLPRFRCQDETVEDPLLEPQQVGGSFAKDKREAFKDRNGDKIESASLERLFVEVDDSHPTVWVAQNVADLELDVFAEMVPTVNDDTLWGLDARKVLLANVTWERKLYGVCDYYYTRRFEFEVNWNTWDEEVADEGTRHLIDNPLNDPPKVSDFEQNKDKNDDNVSTVLPLKADGSIANDPADGNILQPEVYEESDFTLLGIPTSF